MVFIVVRQCFKDLMACLINEKINYIKKNRFNGKKHWIDSILP